MILAEDVVEYLGSIFSRKDLVTHGVNVVSRLRNSIPFVAIEMAVENGTGGRVRPSSKKIEARILG